MRMAIRLTIEAEDPEVEQLLSFLQENCKRQTADKIYLLERAIVWLRATEAFTYQVFKESISTDLALLDTTPIHQLRSETPVGQSQG